MLLASSGAGGAAVFLIFLAVVLGGAFYLLPTIVAFIRKVPNRGSVLVINLFLGWSLIGWVVALAMAARSAPTAPQVNVYTGQPGYPPAGPQPPYGGQ